MQFASPLPHFIDETPDFPDEPFHFYIFLNIVCLQTAKRRGARFHFTLRPLVFFRIIMRSALVMYYF